MTTKQKTEKQVQQERRRRRRDIKRGMKIAFYEVNQLLGAQGLELVVPPEELEYILALAEAGRQGATNQDQLSLAFWEGVKDAREVENSHHAQMSLLQSFVDAYDEATRLMVKGNGIAAALESPRVMRCPHD
jgi:hypothetical protein